MPYATILFLIAQGAALFWLLLHPERLRDRTHLRTAWFCYAVALLPGALSAHVVFLVVAWSSIVASVAFVYLALDPLAEKPASAPSSCPRS